MFVAGCSTVKTRSLAAPTLQQILAEDLSFDAETGEIRYTLPEDALVRIRIGIKEGGALLRTVTDWEFRSKGEHVETWDLKDASGKIDFGVRRDLVMVFAALPANKSIPRIYDPRVRGYRQSPGFSITFPEAEMQADVPVISGNTTLRVTIDADDISWLREENFEIVLFIDQVFLMEEEEGINPFNYFLDTNKFNDGSHVITVNILSFSGEAATEHVNVRIKNNR